MNSRDSRHLPTENGKNDIRRGDNPVIAPSETIQSRISSMLADIHALSRRAQRAASKNATRWAGTYEMHLAALLDEWIAQESGRRQLICIACAAELGVLKSRHLDLANRAIGQTDDRALRALYWSVTKRCVRAVNSGVAARTALDSARTATCLVMPCDGCCELARDNRRSAPHQTLESLGAPPLREDAAPRSVSEFYCSACRAHWVRRISPFDPFAEWKAVNVLSGTFS
ncbi:hypothetical protein [Cupriavidus sp. a3]|uniref:hypothetical protein n=1 Tax=Cupriavidus sp. a3 TaxID=3242158 RepID=UPI003D9C0307